MVFPVLKQSVMISIFVFFMMLLIEYINVQTQGRWKQLLQSSRWGQYLFSAVMGALPGCLGAFTMVSLFAHRSVSFGALVTVMIATSGDEAFVMFSLFPLDAAWLTLLLFAIGVSAGYLTDQIWQRPPTITGTHDFDVHEEAVCRCFPRDEFRHQLLHPTLPRAVFLLLFVGILAALLGGVSGLPIGGWKHTTFTVITVVLLFILATVPDHFLEEHLWRHILKQHLPRIFLWTFGALFFLQFIETYVDVGAWVNERPLVVLAIGVLIGIIPESGPHLLLTTMYADGSLPFAILLANSIVQDGHGMLPLLAASRRVFIATKLINIAVGIIAGLVALALSFL
ncbi:MAG: arsenic efflux protein [Bacteroidetes bacterium]|nr:arsenic efflux protein [Bacteroidota bacterium]